MPFVVRIAPTWPLVVVALLVAALVPVLPAHGAGTASVDVTSTARLIAAYDRMIQARSTDLTAGVAAANGYANAVGRQCPGILDRAPMNGAAAQAMGGEVSGAVAVQLLGPARSAMLGFVHTVGGLLWSNPSVARAVGKFAGAVQAYAGLTSPNVCADLRAWAASGYRTVPASTRAFNFDVNADASQQATAIPTGALAAYETATDAREAAQAAQRASAYARTVSSQILPPINRLLLVLGAH
jgi:hypothetical protein